MKLQDIDLSALTIEELKTLIGQCEQRIEEIQSEQTSGFSQAILDQAQKFGIDPNILLEQIKKEITSKKKSAGKAPPKYQNPDNPSETWNGIGKRPNWYKKQLANGKKEEDLLIDKSAATDREPEQTADDEAAPQSSSTDFGKLTQTG